MLIQGQYLESIKWLENCGSSSRRSKAEAMHIKVAIEFIEKLMKENETLLGIIENKGKQSI
jgi:hypothetical protein